MTTTVSNIARNASIKSRTRLKNLFTSERISGPCWQQNRRVKKADKQEWTFLGRPRSGKTSNSAVVFGERDSNPLQEFPVAARIDPTVDELQMKKKLVTFSTNAIAFCCFRLKLWLFKLVSVPWAVVVAQLVERWLPTPEICSLNPVIGKILSTNLSTNCII